MTYTITATEAKAKILSILDEVAAGAEYEITKRGHVVARLVPVPRTRTIKAMYASKVKPIASDEELFSTGENWGVEVR